MNVLYQPRIITLNVRKHWYVGAIFKLVAHWNILDARLSRRAYVALPTYGLGTLENAGRRSQNESCLNRSAPHKQYFTYESCLVIIETKRERERCLIWEMSGSCAKWIIANMPNPLNEFVALVVSLLLHVSWSSFRRCFVVFRGER